MMYVAIGLLVCLCILSGLLAFSSKEVPTDLDIDSHWNELYKKRLK